MDDTNRGSSKSSIASMLVGCLLSTSSPALAQVADPSEANDIVVTGQLPTKEEARQLAIAFVRETGVAGQQESVARWIDGICPKAFGLSEASAAAVVDQVRAIAAEAGAPLARAGCKTNMALVFTSNGLDFVKTVAHDERTRLSQLSMAERKELVEERAPVRWWYAHQTRSKHGDRQGSDGMPWATGGISDQAGGQAGASGGGSILPMDSDSTALSQYNASIVSTQAVRAITAATVVIDATLAKGGSLDQLAAYAAVVALAEVRNGAQPPGSVLSLFTPAAQPGALTAQDAAFLKAVYSIPLDRKVGQQRNRIVGQIADAAMGRTEP